ncbi:MAG: FtsX-like permease family protein, partial [bacterium]|nr:FtsX-like permease family protein [bacterium]
MTSLLQDLRYALRLIARKPALTALAVVSLGLGIGVNTSIFTLVNAVLLRDLPFARPEELVEVYTTSPDDLGAYSPSSVPDFLDYREQNDVFSGLAAHRSYPLTYDDGEGTELLMGEIVSDNFFDVLGVDAALGRTFLADEDQTPGARPVAVLGHVFWQRRFGGDPSVLGRTLRLNGHPFEVVGIVPESFNGTLAVFRSDLWLPLMMSDQVSMNPILERRGSRSLILKGRLKPGVTIEQAQAQLGTIAQRLAAEYPETNEERGVNLVPTRDVVINPSFDGPVFSAATVLMIVVALVLLIACSNLANLFLAQASDRRKEIALRLALGSGRGRLIRQLLTESLLISFISGLGSLLFATWTARLLVGFRPPIPVPMALDLGVDQRVLGFTLLLAVVTGVLCGLAPALQASRA